MANDVTVTAAPMLRGYAAMISKATGIVALGTLRRIEDTMRTDIFHGTLDWQTTRQFNAGARAAWELIQYMDSDEGQAELARMRQGYLA